MKNHIVGVYENEQQAAEVVEDLKAKGYTTEEISVIAKNINETSEKRLIRINEYYSSRKK